MECLIRWLNQFMNMKLPAQINITIASRPKSGVYLIGAGPGAADLITVRGSKILNLADIVFYDALVDPGMLEWCKNAKLVQVGKRCGNHSTSQKFINKQVVDAATKFPIVVRLKGGDPLIFGRAAEEIEALESANVYFEIVPGITTALAASAELRQPPTVRNISRTLTLTTLPTHLNYKDFGTEIYYMGRDQLSFIAKSLLEKGRPRNTPVCLVESVSLPNQRMFGSTLDELSSFNSSIADAKNTSPLIVLIGKVYCGRSSELLPLAHYLGDQKSLSLSQIAA